MGMRRMMLAAIGSWGVTALMLAAPAPAGAGEPSPERHQLLHFSCLWDGNTGNARTTVRATAQVRKKDMKNNKNARLPLFYKLRTKIEIKTLRIGDQWRTVDSSTQDSVWLERHGKWIHREYTTPSNGVKNSWRMQFGDTTLMTSPGETVRAKITVKLDKKPGLKAWKYTRWTPAVTCSDGFYGSP